MLMYVVYMYYICTTYVNICYIYVLHMLIYVKYMYYIC